VLGGTQENGLPLEAALTQATRAESGVADGRWNRGERSLESEIAAIIGFEQLTEDCRGFVQLWRGYDEVKFFKIALDMLTRSHATRDPERC
jgi:hypothetical protein